MLLLCPPHACPARRAATLRALPRLAPPCLLACLHDAALLDLPWALSPLLSTLAGRARAHAPSAAHGRAPALDAAPEGEGAHGGVREGGSGAHAGGSAAAPACVAGSAEGAAVWAGLPRALQAAVAEAVVAAQAEGGAVG